MHSVCAFAGAAAFFSLALLLSAAFDDICRPLLSACGIAIVIGAWELIAWNRVRFGVFHLMSGAAYFETGSMPWIAILVAAAASAALVAGAAATLARREF